MYIYKIKSESQLRGSDNSQEPTATGAPYTLRIRNVNCCCCCVVGGVAARALDAHPEFQTRCPLKTKRIYD